MLKWQPLQHYLEIKELDKQWRFQNGKREGIYIWGFNDDDGLFWPYYVGKHRNVPFRLCEHLGNLKAGVYLNFCYSDLFATPREKELCSFNLKDRVDFIADANPAAHENIVNMINRFHYTYAVLEDYDEAGDCYERTTIKAFDEVVLVNKRRGPINEPQSIGNLFDVIAGRWKSKTI